MVTLNEHISMKMKEVAKDRQCPHCEKLNVLSRRKERTINKNGSPGRIEYYRTCQSCGAEVRDVID